MSETGWTLEPVAVGDRIAAINLFKDGVHEAHVDLTRQKDTPEARAKLQDNLEAFVWLIEAARKKVGEEEGRGAALGEAGCPRPSSSTTKEEEQ